MSRSYKIKTNWNGKEIDHDPISVSISRYDSGHISIDVHSPFFDDPPNPEGQVGQPFPQLWIYEVIEVFLMNDKEEYLEVEVCPHGQHLTLMLRGPRNILKQELPMEFTAKIDRASKTWTGRAIFPNEYLPPRIGKLNCYAMHGSGDLRHAEALYPATDPNLTEPDFHRLDFFGDMEDRSILPENNWSNEYSSQYWKI